MYCLFGSLPEVGRTERGVEVAARGCGLGGMRFIWLVSLPPRTLCGVASRYGGQLQAYQSFPSRFDVRVLRCRGLSYMGGGGEVGDVGVDLPLARRASLFDDSRPRLHHLQTLLQHLQHSQCTYYYCLKSCHLSYVLSSL